MVDLTFPIKQKSLETKNSYFFSTFHSLYLHFFQFKVKTQGSSMFFSHLLNLSLEIVVKIECHFPIQPDSGSQKQHATGKYLFAVAIKLLKN